ncbi:transmembrane protein 203 isoform X3 [Heterodontus francisci]|uniref:transmembrane protein 203 isoform X3 n=1 Tax=Heterodontus francisci TaxID=7792 RepID=UPI00355C3A41
MRPGVSECLKLKLCVVFLDWKSAWRTRSHYATDWKAQITYWKQRVTKELKSEELKISSQWIKENNHSTKQVGVTF